MSKSRRALGSVAAVTLAFAWAGAASGAAPILKTRPRLILFIAVDQMRYDYLRRFEPLFTGGLARLLKQGAIFTNALYRHANTETGPGHSVMLSGSSALHSGIVYNEWYDTKLGKVVNVVDDANVSPVGGNGMRASPANFIGFTLGDALKKASPASKVVGISFKDRAAILPTGPKADAAYWFDNASGRFVTSTYYMKKAPEWLDAFNATRPADAYAGREWTRLLSDESVYLRYSSPDRSEGESDGRDVVFPHQVHGTPSTPQYYEDMRRTPFADEVLLEFALKTLDGYALGRHAVTDVFTVSFSAMDGIGHTYGPDSQEAMDQLLRLDRLIGKLFDAIDASVGLDHTLVGLSADHGVLPLVERLKARGIEARRIPPAEPRRALEQALAERFPLASGLIAAFRSPSFYLDLEKIRKAGLRRTDVEAEAKKALLATGFVAAVYTHDDLRGAPPADDPFFALERASFFPERSPHVIVRLKPYTLLSAGGGTTHGTPYEYDRHVPIVLMGTGILAGRYDESCGPEDIAPSLGALLGLDYPMQDARRLLSEAWEPSH